MRTVNVTSSDSNAKRIEPLLQLANVEHELIQNVASCPSLQLDTGKMADKDELDA